MKLVHFNKARMETAGNYVKQWAALETSTKVFALLVLLFVSHFADCMLSGAVTSQLGGVFCFSPKDGADI